MSTIMSLLAHPDDESFCAALEREFTAELTKASASLPPASDSLRIVSHKLYHGGFNPVMSLPEMRRHLPIDNPAMEYIRSLNDCRELVLFFPDWWGAEPAILKGFFDRVLRQGIAYDRAEQAGGEKSAESRGLLTDCGLSLWICSDSSGSQLSNLVGQYEQRFRNIIVAYCGFRSLQLTICSPLNTSSLKKRRAWLEDCRAEARAIVARYAKYQ